MARNKYSAQIEGGAKAYARNINVSPKHAIAVCSAIRGKTVKKAKEFLERVEVMKEPVPLRRFNKKVPHRKGGQPGRFHVKAAGILLKLIGNVENNADQKEMDTDKLLIVHAAAHRGPTYNRRRSKGRMRTSDIDTVNIELIVKEA